MSSNKCRNCGLVGAAYDRACRKCGCVIDQVRNPGTSGPREPSKPSSFLYTLLAAVLIGGGAYYLYHGLEKSYEKIGADEANRLAAQPAVSPAPLTSRAESDQGRAQSYKNAVANSPNLAASQKHNDEVKELMKPAPK